jgi:hypothetical protein
MAYRIISADCHIDMTWMPGNLWVENAPARWRDHVPQVRETPDGPHWYAEGQELGVFGGLGFGFDRVQRGYSKHVERMFEAGFYEGGPHPTTPALRLKDQEIDGIDAEVMYGILGIGQRLHDPELIQVYEIYNAPGPTSARQPRRFVGLACFPITIRRRPSLGGPRALASRAPISPSRPPPIPSGTARGTRSGPW